MMSPLQKTHVLDNFGIAAKRSRKRLGHLLAEISPAAYERDLFLVTVAINVAHHLGEIPGPMSTRRRTFLGELLIALRQKGELNE
jgi:hypothetical protein